MLHNKIASEQPRRVVSEAATQGSDAIVQGSQQYTLCSGLLYIYISVKQNRSYYTLQACVYAAYHSILVMKR